jgi:phosphatidylethanolamine-binding protein
VPAQQPVVAVDTAGFESIANYNGPYTLLMVDPDARYPQSPNLRWILHWLQTDLTTAPPAVDGTSQLVNSTAPRAQYMRPAPPTNSSAHRYILYAFQQPPNFVIPQAFEGYGGMNRTMFNLTQFLDASNLGQTPAAAMYFYASNQTIVPQDFIAPPGSTYPGGNGDMITVGSTSTGSSATATATITPAATYTGAASVSHIGASILLAAGVVNMINVL